jgi:hypothetical protein
MTAVRPFGNLLTVTRFSKEARSWAEHTEESSKARVASLIARDIEPPGNQCGAICYGRETRFDVSSRDFVKLKIGEFKALKSNLTKVEHLAKLD